MKIDIMIYEVGNVTDVRTIAYVGDKIYGDSTHLMTTERKSDKKRAMELEILESVKRHLDRIQQNLLTDVEKGNSR